MRRKILTLRRQGREAIPLVLGRRLVLPWQQMSKVVISVDIFTCITGAMIKWDKVILNCSGFYLIPIARTTILWDMIIELHSQFRHMCVLHGTHGDMATQN
jgi:hypothetical protein